METKTFTLHVTALKTRLDKAVVELMAEHEPKLARAHVQKGIADGRISVNGVAATESKHIVRAGDVITYDYTPADTVVAKNLALHTVYQGYDMLIVDKPAGLSSHPAAGFKGDSLAEIVLFHFPQVAEVGEADRPGIVHRLDKDTSGLMVVALTPAMYDYLKAAFAERTIEKEYIALVKGDLLHDHGFIDLPVGKSKKDFRQYTTNIHDMVLSKDAMTEYTVLERLSRPNSRGIDEYTLIKVKLHTGRMHQIRVHFAALDAPVIGDKLYGNNKAAFPGLSRQFLHARRLVIPMPDGTTVERTSPLPDDLRHILNQLHATSVSEL
jgi:23S rRNA pseudouridine1911/1915/1917 synthase